MARETTAMNSNEIAQFCWFMLCHMLERSTTMPDGWALPLLWAPEALAGTVADPSLLGAIQQVNEYTRASAAELARDPANAVEPLSPRREACIKLVEQLEGILISNRLSEECRRAPDSWGPESADDGPTTGYSRDPFKKVRDDDKPPVALAVVCYLARAHALFFCLPKTKRRFSAAKVALNDLFQASQLATRLYYSLSTCHLLSHSREAYLREVTNGPGAVPGPTPWDSPFFVWWMIQLVAIQRGNIYRQLDYLTEADRYYRHALTRFDSLSCGPLEVHAPQMVSDNDPWFITPTFVRANFERSKVLFDLGLFIEATMNQLRCLAFLLRMTSQSAPSQDTARALEALRDGLRFLDVVRRQPVWDKQTITELFGLGDPETSDGPLAEWSEKPCINPGLLGGLAALNAAEKTLAAEVFARLGFMLTVLTRKRLATAPWNADEKDGNRRGQRTIEATLRPFFEIHTALTVRQPPLAQYCMSIIGPNRDAGGPDAQARAVAFDDSPERQFAHRLRGTLHERGFAGEPLTEGQFYGALLDLVTQQIDNVVTIPNRIHSYLMRAGYKKRRSDGLFSKPTLSGGLRALLTPVPAGTRRTAEERAKDTADKLVILRRWQSFTPKVPRPHGVRVRGGGYFLFWRGKGIAIDPGYDFIQNLYDEGYSLEDIDAVVVTHSHPDHDDELATLTTLVREWNEYHRDLGSGEPIRPDLFLNESAHLKFSPWLKASDVSLGRIIQLPLVVWDRDSKTPGEQIRGSNVVLDLRNKYSLQLEVVPAWHDDVIGKTAAVGLKFHLYDSPASSEALGIVGCTGDTCYYGDPAEDAQPAARASDTASAPPPQQPPLRIADQYRDCDVLIAHLGDIRLRELFTAIDTHSVRGDKMRVRQSVVELLYDWFNRSDDRAQVDFKKIDPTRVDAFLRLLVTLGIAPGWALTAPVVKRRQLDDHVNVSDILNLFVVGQPLDLNVAYTQIAPHLQEQIHDNMSIAPDEREGIQAQLHEIVRKLYATVSDPPHEVEEKRLAYLLLGFLCTASSASWRYPYHLGIRGLFRLHNAMAGTTKDPVRQRVFLVGELPEELASYRQHVARLLNVTAQNWTGTEPNPHRLYAFTTDIGLHVGLDKRESNGREYIDPTVRCAYCNHNNETVLGKKNYHSPDKIRETQIVRLDSAMIYLCTEHDHHTRDEPKPRDFLSHPHLTVI